MIQRVEPAWWQFAMLSSTLRLSLHDSLAVASHCMPQAVGETGVMLCMCVYVNLSVCMYM